MQFMIMRETDNFATAVEIQTKTSSKQYAFPAVINDANIPLPRWQRP